jgi:acylphosphatase
MKINKQVKITGKVQGVFFRKSTWEKAITLGIKGWVRNDSDGSVLVEMEGNHTAITEMEKWLRKGSPLAKVDFLEITEGNERGHQEFLILN